ncbi:MAG: carboxypeptidase-like regulatory domain-containing protein [Bryobacterales bacterium]|nr:carboxypeptidase-like regulatory domain-containing protein [Bryobacterales bacterium]
MLIAFWMLLNAGGANGQGNASRIEPAAVSGQIVNLVTGVAVGTAALTLSSTSQSYTTRSDLQGRFTFESVAPGSYRLTGEREGYLTHEYGYRWSSGAGVASTLRRRYPTAISHAGLPLTLRPGHRIKDLLFKLTPESTIRGRVVDDRNEPVVGAFIHVRREGYKAGARHLVSAQNAFGDVSGSTDASGEYRLDKLHPGAYFISAHIMDVKNIAPADPQREAEEKLVSTFYPNSIDPSGAAAVGVFPGQELAGIDIRLQKSRVVRISGKVVFEPLLSKTGQTYRVAC